MLWLERYSRDTLVISNKSVVVLSDPHLKRRNFEIPFMRMKPLPVLLVACFYFITGSCNAKEFDRVPKALISKHCIDCHSGDDAEGAMNLTELLKTTETIGSKDLIPVDVAAKWTKVERAILQARMPPVTEGKLKANERERFVEWLHARIILKGGRSHIGPTPLRRLTHYEFLNSLEDLLGVTVRAEYNFLSSVNVERSFVQKLLPIEVPGINGFVNDAHAQATQQFPLLEYVKCVDFALSRIRKDKQSLKTLFGFDKVPAKLSNIQVRKIAASFLKTRASWTQH